MNTEKTTMYDTIYRLYGKYGLPNILKGLIFAVELSGAKFENDKDYQQYVQYRIAVLQDCLAKIDKNLADIAADA